MACLDLQTYSLGFFHQSAHTRGDFSEPPANVLNCQLHFHRGPAADPRWDIELPCVCSGFPQWYQWYTNIVQGFTNGTIGNTICTNGNANCAIGSPSGTIGTIGKPMVPLVSQWYHWLPMVPLVKLPMVPLGEPRTEPI